MQVTSLLMDINNNPETKGINMSVIYCNYCDNLSDTDYAPDFDYNEKTGEWKCESCKEEDGEVIAYSELGTYLEKLREEKNDNSN
jgi:hypothetical protein